MTVDYKQLKAFVKEAMFTGGGINQPSAPEGIPHRMPAADGADKQQNMGDAEANKMLEFALTAREATEVLVEKLDEPIFDEAYEHAFKASACLRRAINSIQRSGAHAMPWQHVVSPPADQQKYNAGGGDYAGGAGAIPFGSLEELETGQESPDVLRLKEMFDNLDEQEQIQFIAMLPSPEEGIN
jgi:hypothetical protein